MTSSDDRTALLLAIWRNWADRIAGFDDTVWRTPTRLPGWDVAALCAHVCPDPEPFRQLPSMVVDRAPVAATAADIYRAFNADADLAEAAAVRVEQQGRDAAQLLSRADMIERFTRSVPAALAAAAVPLEATIVSPAMAMLPASFGAFGDVAIADATVHLLDLVASVGGAPPPSEALSFTCSMLVDVYGAQAFVDGATGRTPLGPALR